MTSIELSSMNRHILVCGRSDGSLLLYITGLSESDMEIEEGDDDDFGLSEDKKSFG